MAGFSSHAVPRSQQYQTSWNITVETPTDSVWTCARLVHRSVSLALFSVPYEPAQGLFTGLSVWLCSRSRMNLRKACSQVSQSGSVLGPVWTCARLVHTSLSLALFSVLLCYLITMCPQLQHRRCFVADQLWLMTCIREEEDYVPTITAQSQSECQLSAASRLISRLHSRLDPTITVLYRMCKTDLMHWVTHTTLFTYLNTVNWMFISVVCTV